MQISKRHIKEKNMCKATLKQTLTEIITKAAGLCVFYNLRHS